MPTLADVAEPLRRLTMKDIPFHWESQQEDSFNKLKKMLSPTPVLQYYDINTEVTLKCNASEKGLGATLLQNRQPVAFTSRTLGISEQNYAQIEKECLANGCEEKNIHTDHNPLVPIFRLQRFDLKFQ